MLLNLYVVVVAIIVAVILIHRTTSNIVVPALRGMGRDRMKSIANLAHVSTFLTFLGMKYIDDRFATERVPFGQVSMQISATAANAKWMMESWTPQQRNWFLASLALDHWFIVTYTASLALLLMLTIDVEFDQISLVTAILCGAFFDLIEGYLLYVVATVTPELLLSQYRRYPLYVLCMAVPKFLLIGLCIFVVVYRGLYLPRREAMRLTMTSREEGTKED